jgi:DNA-directed RNA polymerase subunit L
MEVKIINSSKDELEIELENITLAEILRAYLNQDSNVDTTAWKQKHPTEKPILLVRTKGKTPKKAISDAISTITKQLESIEKDFKSLK